MHTIRRMTYRHYLSEKVIDICLIVIQFAQSEAIMIIELCPSECNHFAYKYELGTDTS